MAPKKEDSTFRFKVEGDDRVYEIDPLNLTYGEMAEAEEMFDCAYDEIPLASARFTQFCVALAIGKDNPTFTRDDAGKLRADDIEVIEARPTKASSRSGTKKSAPSSE